MVHQVNREPEQAHCRHLETLRPKDFCQAHVVPRFGWRQKPGLVDQLGKIDHTMARPSAVQSYSDDQWVVEETFHVQIVRYSFVRTRRRPSQENEIELSVAQSRIFGGGRRHIVY